MKWGADPPGCIVEVGESRMHVRIRGSGSPTVVFEAGIAATSLSWALVEPAVSSWTTAVTYDRAGLGWSGPAVTPRTPTVAARELRSALDIAGAKAPFVVVGHSFGALVAKRFASLFPVETVGVVLVDALRVSEFWPLSPPKAAMVERGVRLARRGAVLAKLGIVGGSLRVLLAGNRLVPKVAAWLSSGSGGAGFTDRLAGEIRKLPSESWPVIAWHWSQAKNFEGMAKHLETLPESCREMSECALSDSIPVTALIAEKAPMDGLPGSWRVLRAEGSGHWVQLDRPELVISEIERLVVRVRSGCEKGDRSQ